MGPTRMPGRGLTPILVLLVVAPPRVCTCDHAHGPPPESAAVACDVGPAEAHPARHEHDDDSDCPCVKPSQLTTSVLAAGVAAPPAPVLHGTLGVLADHHPAGDAPAPVTRRTGDPPLYLTHCSLRF